MTRLTAILRASLVLITGGLVMSACAGSTSTANPHGPSYEVTTASVGGLGQVLVNGSGLTLYLFQPDNHSGHSTCAGPCAAAWPPVLLPPGVTSPSAGKGIDGALLGATTRPDGTRQVTYGGWPLYLWVNDTSPGMATGQGIENLGGYWYAVSPDGRPNGRPNPNGF